MKHAALLAALAALGMAAPADAQEGADKTRLDEFALPHGPSDIAVDQLDPDADRFAPAAALSSDRALDVPGPPLPERTPVAQLSTPGETMPAAQVSESGESRELAANSVSSPGDSRPQPSAPLAGTDRCDAQLETEELERCQRILERRAAEFDAPEAPRMSAEQALLAETGEEVGLASPSPEKRLRLAVADDPDAELDSNQELAAIYLDRDPAPPTGVRPDEPHPDDAALAEALQGMQIDVSGSGAP